MQTTVVTCRSHRVQAWSGLALLLLLTGCAVTPSLEGPGWYGQTRPITAQDFPEAARAGQQAVEVDFEVLTPRQAEVLRQRGVEMPRVSSELAELRDHRDFVERRVTAVGFGLGAGGYLLYCEGLPLPVLVPESHVDLGLTSAVPLNASIYPDRDTALVDMAAGASGEGHARYAWYRGAGGALIVPTLFSPVTTPRIARTMLEVRKHLGETTQRELKVLLLTLTGTRVLQGVFSRVVRVGTEPAPRPLTRKEGLGGEAAAPQQQVTRAAAPTPQPAATPAAPASGPVASARAPAAPASTPGSLAPSPGLLQALTGNNPTRAVASDPRLPQDVAVSSKVPRLRQLNRPISSSPSQNAQIQADIEYLQSIGARNIRVNQQQLTMESRQRVGINRPDLQFDYNDRRFHVEYDTPASGRGPGHQSRITSNDPDAETILLIVP